MERCHNCKRLLKLAKHTTTFGKVTYCSVICRQKCRGKTHDELKTKLKEKRIRSIKRGLPLTILEAITLGIALLTYLTLNFKGRANLYDMITGIIYLLPGGMMGIGLHTMCKKHN